MTRFENVLSLTFPEFICKSFRDHAEFLYNDLMDNKLVVKKVKPENHKYGEQCWVRAVESENPKWYQEISLDHMNQFKSKSGTHRSRQYRSLQRIITGKDGKFLYHSFRFKWDVVYRELIFKRLTEGFEDKGMDIPPDNDVRNYFIKDGLIDGKIIIINEVEEEPPF